MQTQSIANSLINDHTRADKMGPKPYSHPVDVIDIRSDSGTATGRPLKDEVLDSIRGGNSKQSVCEGSESCIEWSRSIPTG